MRRHKGNKFDCPIGAICEACVLNVVVGVERKGEESAMQCLANQTVANLHFAKLQPCSGPFPSRDRGPQLRHCTDEHQNIQLRCNKFIYCIPGYKSSPAESPIQTSYNERNQSVRAPKQPYIAYKANELFCSRRGVNPAPQRHKQDLIRLP